MERIYEMANRRKRQTGLPINIWIDENGILWNEFNEKSHPTISSKDKSYLVKRIDSNGSKIIFVSKYYDYDE